MGRSRDIPALATHGVLFLDELTEFRRAIEAARAPAQCRPVRGRSASLRVAGYSAA
ncbi:MAG: ATP-binding protein [Actinomycetota bacterium]